MLKCSIVHSCGGVLRYVQADGDLGGIVVLSAPTKLKQGFVFHALAPELCNIIAVLVELPESHRLATIITDVDCVGGLQRNHRAQKWSM